MAKVVVFEDSREYRNRIGAELNEHGHIVVASADTLPGAYDVLNRMIRPVTEDRKLFSGLTALVLAGRLSYNMRAGDNRDFRGPTLVEPEAPTGMFARFRKSPTAPDHIIPYGRHLTDADMVVDIMQQYQLARPGTEDEPLPIIGMSRAPLRPLVTPELDLTKNGMHLLGETVTWLAMQQQALPEAH